MGQKADVLIVTATEVEGRAVIAAFREATGREPKAEPIGDRIYLDLGEISRGRVFLALSGMGTSGVTGSQEAVRKGIESLAPSSVVMVGIAFGINERNQHIGDVLVSEQLLLYDLQRVGTDKEGQLKILPRGDRPHASSRLLNRFQVANLSWDVSKAKVRFGLVLSGDKLVDNTDFRSQLLMFEQEAIGGEMEGAGLYVACQNSKVDWILIKAICDWADGQKANDKVARQELAARNATAFVLHALQQAPVYPSPEPSPQVAIAPVLAAKSGNYNDIYSSIPPQPYFFGRDLELENIAEAILPEARTWGALIDGPGGIGKTALAIRAGHLASSEHFDRKIFLSAKVRELTSIGEHDLEDFMLSNYMFLLAELARELGEENIAQSLPHERANAVRRALAKSRVLLLVDNVETFPEIERIRLYQFLSRLPTTCKAIVTSRRRTDVDVRVVRLDRLGREHSLALLNELAKTNRYLRSATAHERDTLYEITNGNPLLIKWTVGQLGRKGSRCRTIADVGAFLKVAPKGNDPLDYIFGDLLDTLTSSEIAVLGALTHFSEFAKVRWIADVANIAEIAARTALEDLTDRALIVSDAESQAFVLPPLAAMFLRRHRPEVIATAGNRLTNRALALALENKRIERFPVLEDEWPTISAALPLIMQGENNRLQIMCSALDKFLEFSGRWDERLVLSQRAEEKALLAGDFYNAGWQAHETGLVFYRRGQAHELMECAKRCAAHWQVSPQAGIYEEVSSLSLIGHGHLLERNYAAAMDAYRLLLDICRSSWPESEDLAIALADIAEAERLQGDYVAATRHLQEALQIAKKIDDFEGIVTFTASLADVALDRGAWSDAETLAQEALERASVLGRLDVVGVVTSCLAIALARQGKAQEGLAYARRSLEIFTRLRIVDDVDRAKRALSECGG